MGIIAIIPARYASSRFPGKLLANQTGKYLIQHVYEQVSRAQRVDSVLIATDDERIGDACDRFGAAWRMTRSAHPSGTDRIAEVAADLQTEIIVNVQGDEPEIDPANIDRLIKLLQADTQADMATLAARFMPGEDIKNPNIVKVVMDRQDHALYFSRWPIPYRRDSDNIAAPHIYCKHIGIYAYRRPVLMQLSRMPLSPLEQAEKLEQLRALENGLTIAVARVNHNSAGIDTPQQYHDFVRRYRRKATTCNDELM